VNGWSGHARRQHAKSVQNRAWKLGLIARFYHEMWNRFDKTLIPVLLTEDVRFRGSLGQKKNGHTEFAKYIDFVERAFPDFSNEIEESDFRRRQGVRPSSIPRHASRRDLRNRSDWKTDSICRCGSLLVPR
jgi:hypothetical protein